jgi:flagellar biosynthesis/type III secretory pathway protein FliH
MRRLSAPDLQVDPAHRAWPTVEEAASIRNASREADAQASAEVYKRGYLEGFDAGHADGDKAARAALADAEREAQTQAGAAREAVETWHERLSSMADRFAHAEGQLHEEMEALAVEIAFTATCRMVGELHTKRELVAAFCQQAVMDLRLTPTELRISPSDFASLAEHDLGMSCVADPAMQTGDCVIVTPLGEVDVGVETRLRAVMRVLLDTVRSSEVKP